MSEIKKMFCPSCGAPVSFEPGRENTFCSHCGSQLYFHDDHLEVKLKYEEVKMEYEDRREERKLREIGIKGSEVSDKMETIQIVGALIFAFVVLILIFVFAM